MVSFVIIDYKSYERTARFVADVYQRVSCDADINIAIVDNSVDIENFKKLRDEFLKSGLFDPKEYISQTEIVKYEGRVLEMELMDGKRGGLLLVRSSENGGYAKGNNIGAAAARDFFDDRYILFSNNDIIFEEDFDIGILLMKMESDSAVAVTGPRITGIDGLRQSPYKKVGIWGMHIVPYLLWPAMAVANRIAGKKNLLTDMDIMYESGYVYRVMGSFMAVRSSAFFEIGMFDENTFLYAEEMILSERLAGNGYRTYYEDECSVVHEHGASTEKSFKRIRVQRLKLESSLYYHKKYRGAADFEIALARFAFLIYEKVYFPVRSGIKGD